MQPRALVCEDDSTLRAAVGELLSAHGWAISEAATASDAIDLARTLHPDLIVLDVELAGMSGLESIPRVRACTPGVRVVAMTCTRQGADLCLEAGACAVVTADELDRLDQLLTDLDVHAA